MADWDLESHRTSRKELLGLTQAHLEDLLMSSRTYKSTEEHVGRTETMADLPHLNVWACPLPLLKK